MQRTIMIFTQFDNIDVINSIRNKYDPLAKLVKPHITVGKLGNIQELNKAFESLMVIVSGIL